MKMDRTLRASYRFCGDSGAARGPELLLEFLLLPPREAAVHVRDLRILEAH